MADEAELCDECDDPLCAACGECHDCDDAEDCETVERPQPRDATVELSSAVALMIVVSFVILVTSLEVGETSRTAWIVLGVIWAIVFLIRPRLSRWLVAANAEFSVRTVASALLSGVLVVGSGVAAAEAAGVADHGYCARGTFMCLGWLVTMMLDLVRRPAFRFPDAPDDA